MIVLSVQGFSCEEIINKFFELGTKKGIVLLSDSLKFPSLKCFLSSMLYGNTLVRNGLWEV